MTQTQQRPESPTVTLTWHTSKYEVRKLHERYILRGVYEPCIYSHATWKVQEATRVFVTYYVCVTSFECKLTPLLVEKAVNHDHQLAISLWTTRIDEIQNG